MDILYSRAPQICIFFDINEMECELKYLFAIKNNIFINIGNGQVLTWHNINFWKSQTSLS